MMELSQRKRKLLALIVERYIASGEPVGSSVLCSALAVSSATVRNEMAELSAMGLLDQPHTSAGRMPTQRGLRYYLDNLINPAELSNADRFRIESRFDMTLGDPVKILEQTGRILSSITGCAVAMSTPFDSQASIRRVEIVPVGNYTALVVMMISTGVVKSSICKCSVPLDMDTVQLFYSLAGSCFIGRRTDELTAGAIQSITASLGDKMIAMLPLMVTLRALVSEASQSQILTSGESNLLYLDGFDSEAHSVMEFMKHTDALARVLSSPSDGVRVTLGRENRYRELENTAVMTVGYSVLGRQVGSLAVIGSLRSDYSRLIPCLKFTSELVGRALSQAIEE